MNSQQVQDLANLLTISMAVCYFLRPLADILVDAAFASLKKIAKSDIRDAVRQALQKNSPFNKILLAAAQKNSPDIRNAHILHALLQKTAGSQRYRRFSLA